MLFLNIVCLTVGATGSKTGARGRGAARARKHAASDEATTAGHARTRARTHGAARGRSGQTGSGFRRPEDDDHVAVDPRRRRCQCQRRQREVGPGSRPQKIAASGHREAVVWGVDDSGVASCGS
jgi:hypothetical protein